MPRMEGLLFFRVAIQWVGGMFFLVIAFLFLSDLSDIAQRSADRRLFTRIGLVPKLSNILPSLMMIYGLFTVTAFISFNLAGESVFDSVCHALSTVSTGGFTSTGRYLPEGISFHFIAIFFMFLAGVNFALHFVAFRNKSVLDYWHDPEFRFYLFLILIVSLTTIFGLYFYGTYDSAVEAMVKGLFQAVSIGTTTGFTTAEYYNWPGFLTILLLFASFVGGCAGSTGGGIKVVRVLLLIKQGMREILRLIHPNAKIPVRIGTKVVPSNVVEAVWGFFALYVASFTIMYLLLAATGIELMTAFSAVAACINNLGPGLAGVGANYAELQDSAKWLLCFAMLLGRLEIFTLLVLLTPAFWRR